MDMIQFSYGKLAACQHLRHHFINKSLDGRTATDTLFKVGNEHFFKFRFDGLAERCKSTVEQAVPTRSGDRDIKAVWIIKWAFLLPEIS